MSINNICIVGLGYIGLPTAALLANSGVEVLGCDINKHVIDSINNGKSHFTEPGLDEMVESVVSSGMLRVSEEHEACDAYIIAVPTPFKEDNEPDLSYVLSACEGIAPHLKKNSLIILESTSPVGTSLMLAQLLATLRPDLQFPMAGCEISPNEDYVKIAYCPERVLPGSALKELVANERVIGGITKRCAEAAVSLYKKFVTGACYITDTKTAEMCKLVENSFRDVNIAFANELSMLSQSLGVDVWELISLANKHPRVNILSPGPGVGGHCIAVDPWFLVKANEQESNLIKCARLVNDAKPYWVINEFYKAVEGLKIKSETTPVKKIVVGVYGITFKADIEDTRESPALKILEILSKNVGFDFKVVDPNVHSRMEWWGENIELDKLENAVRDCHLHLLLVKHREFSQSIFSKIDRSKLIDVVGLC